MKSHYVLPVFFFNVVLGDHITELNLEVFRSERDLKGTCKMWDPSLVKRGAPKTICSGGLTTIWRLKHQHLWNEKQQRRVLTMKLRQTINLVHFGL